MWWQEDRKLNGYGQPVRDFPDSVWTDVMGPTGRGHNIRQENRAVTI